MFHQIRNTNFAGTVKLGDTTGTVQGLDGILKNCGIYNATIANNTIYGWEGRHIDLIQDDGVYLDLLNVRFERNLVQKNVDTGSIGYLFYHQDPVLLKIPPDDRDLFLLTWFISFHSVGSIVSSTRSLRRTSGSMT